MFRDELGKPFWGTPERYMRKSMLLTFVKKMGHEYESILDDAIEKERETEVVETALVAANHQIASTIEGDDEGDEDLESDDDKENEEEDEKKGQD